MIGAIAKAVDQLGDRAFRSVLIKAVGLTVGVLVALYALAAWLVSGLGPYDLPWIGVVDPGAWATGLAVGAVMLASVFLMIPVASICIGFFLEDIAAAVEARHYPALPPATRLSFAAALLDALQFFGVLVAANLAALVIYLLVPLLAPVIFYLVNGYLLGREYFQLVALRRIPKADARRLRRRHGGRIWLMGIAMAVPLSIPIVNLLVPLVGVAAYTHLFHDVGRDRASAAAV
ncbi:EI24 domain-containing protein [Pontivivens ytuae]|uniref:EI24 domain-containing protein n=1 Tax=Pontivivens ytuae TaxID=2789856 RepID=A0A7S9QB42_9RHOB|nr:EI24 domain-containing protein [Pontivivens ytuae]QPH52773.1 EI24 domain-containing protein [Pontivivens ytuae]